MTCADNSGGCHSLPLTSDSTNSTTVGGFDAPTMRGLWDRSIIFSNGNISSDEWMRLAQACADGNPPGGHPRVSVLGFPQPNLITGDPAIRNWSQVAPQKKNMAEAYGLLGAFKEEFFGVQDR